MPYSVITAQQACSTEMVKSFKILLVLWFLKIYFQINFYVEKIKYIDWQSDFVLHKKLDFNKNIVCRRFTMQKLLKIDKLVRIQIKSERRVL